MACRLLDTHHHARDTDWFACAPHGDVGVLACMWWSPSTWRSDRRVRHEAVWRTLRALRGIRGSGPVPRNAVLRSSRRLRRGAGELRIRAVREQVVRRHVHDLPTERPRLRGVRGHEAVQRRWRMRNSACAMPRRRGDGGCSCGSGRRPAGAARALNAGRPVGRERTRRSQKREGDGKHRWSGANRPRRAIRTKAAAVHSCCE